MRYALAALLAFGAISSTRGLSISGDVTGAAGVLLTRASPFPAKPQASLTAKGTGRLNLGDIWGLFLSVSVHEVAPSSAEGWYTYRGYGGLAVSLGADVALWSAAAREQRIRLGISGALGGAFSRYSGTSHYFFNPSISVEPFLVILPVSGGPAGFRVSLPLMWEFRKDLVISAYLGFSAGFTVLSRGRA